MKTSLPVVGCALVSASIACAEPLFSNASPDPAIPALAASGQTESGVPAPAGAMWSECGRAGGEADLFAGFSCHPDAMSNNAAFRFADDFRVSSDYGWRASSIVVYAYCPGTSGSASPFSTATVRIWTGRPDAPQSLLYWGDLSTNRLFAVQRAGVYRVFNTTPLPAASASDQSRAIWALTLTLDGLFLAPGTYWFDFQISCLDPEKAAYVVPATIAGSRGPANANAMQLRPGGLGVTWSPVTDPGKPQFAADVPQDIAFRIEGAALTMPCPADFNGDGGVDGGDVEAFFRAWSASEPSADTNQDGGVDGADVEAFFLFWQAGGC